MPLATVIVCVALIIVHAAVSLVKVGSLMRRLTVWQLLVRPCALHVDDHVELISV